jgi:hypothetical protein
MPKKSQVNPMKPLLLGAFGLVALFAFQNCSTSFVDSDHMESRIQHQSQFVDEQTTIANSSTVDESEVLDKDKELFATLFPK